MPNINNRTIFEADNLNILRGVNSESIDLTLPGLRHSSLTGTMRRLAIIQTTTFCGSS